MSVHVWLIDLPRCCTLLSNIVCSRVRLGPTGFPHGAFPQRSSCGEPFPAEATGALPGAKGQTTAGRRFHPVGDATLSRMFQWRDALVNVKPETLPLAYGQRSEHSRRNQAWDGRRDSPRLVQDRRLSR